MKIFQFQLIIYMEIVNLNLNTILSLINHLHIHIYLISSVNFQQIKNYNIRKFINLHHCVHYSSSISVKEPTISSHLSFPRRNRLIYLPNNQERRMKK